MIFLLDCRYFCLIHTNNSVAC